MNAVTDVPLHFPFSGGRNKGRFYHHCLLALF